MRLNRWQITSAVAAALLWAAPMIAKVNTGTEVNKPKPVPTKAVRTAWPQETLAGTIMMVDSSRRLVVVKGPGDVPFDMRVGRQTKILEGKQAVKLSDLSRDLNQRVQVRFTPERSGDVAQLIKLQK